MLQTCPQTAQKFREHAVGSRPGWLIDGCDRRRRGWPKHRREPESEDEEDEEEEQQEEEPREEENTEAVPVGDPVKVTGKGKKQKKHYISFEYEGNTFELVSRRLLPLPLPDFCRVVWF